MPEDQISDQNNKIEADEAYEILMAALMVDDREFTSRFTQEALIRWPEDPRFIMADATLSIKDHGQAQALEKYKKCLELDPQFTCALLNMFSSAIKLKDETSLKEVFTLHFLRLSELKQWEFLFAFQMRAKELNFSLDKFKRLIDTTDFSLIQKISKITRLLKRMAEGHQSQIEILVPPLE